MKGLSKKKMAKQGKSRPLKPFRDAASQLWRKVANVLLIFAAAAVIGAVGGVAARGMRKVLTQSNNFAIREIEVSGNSHVSKDEILRRSGLKEGLNIFTVDLERAAQSVDSHPWIKGVTIKRKFPNKIVIHVIERKAAAIVRQEGYLKLMDLSGEVFKVLESGDPVDMPVIDGPGGTDVVLSNRAKADIFGILDLARISTVVPISSISEIMVNPSGYELMGVGELCRVRLGDGDIKNRWAVLELVLTDARRSGSEIMGVDLRYKDGAVLKLKADAKTLLADVRRVNSNGTE
jgi:cell division protein FtsQ